MAEVKLSFPAWTEGKVIPATAKIPIAVGNLTKDE